MTQRLIRQSRRPYDIRRKSLAKLPRQNVRRQYPGIIPWLLTVQVLVVMLVHQVSRPTSERDSGLLFVPPQTTDSVHIPILPVPPVVPPTAVPVSVAENSHTGVTPAPTRTDLPGINSTESSDISDKDEYFDFDRFTHNFYEYEQGQKSIIVKGRLKKHVKFWQDIGASEFILDVINSGYKLPFYSNPPNSFSKNNRSALCEPEFVNELFKIF